MGPGLHWPHSDGLPIPSLGLVQLPGLAVRHGGVEHVVVVAGGEGGGVAQQRRGLGEPLLVHQVEAVLHVHVGLGGRRGLGTLEPSLRLLVPRFL